MEFRIDRESGTPLYRQLETTLREQIQSGALAPDTRLPSSRELAGRLGVNRVTVTNAYADLEADGLLYSLHGSGTYVSPPIKGLEKRQPGALEEWPVWQSEAYRRSRPFNGLDIDEMMARARRPGVITFAPGVSDSSLFRTDEFRKVLQLVLQRDGVEALEYGDRRGYPALRKTIASILASQGIPANPDDVLITSGSQQALLITAGALLRPGDSVLVEAPTYSTALELFSALGARIIGVPVDEKGMQVEQVESLIRAHHPRLIYTIPNFQNPTGACLSGHRRRELAALARRWEVPVVEDDFVGDLRYEGRAQPALKSLDTHGDVIYISSFSKMLMPGLRLGYIVANGPVYEALIAQKRINDLNTSNFSQRAVEAYITVGRYRAHLRRACQFYSRRRDTFMAALTREMPPEVRWMPPQGGLFVWLELPPALTWERLLPAAVDEGVAFMPGSPFFPDGSGRSCMRLNFTLHPSEVIDTGVRRLARVIRRFLNRL